MVTKKANSTLEGLMSSWVENEDISLDVDVLLDKPQQYITGYIAVPCGSSGSSSICYSIRPYKANTGSFSSSSSYVSVTSTSASNLYVDYTY